MTRTAPDASQDKMNYLTLGRTGGGGGGGRERGEEGISNPFGSGLSIC